MERLGLIACSLWACSTKSPSSGTIPGSKYGSDEEVEKDRPKGDSSSGDMKSDKGSNSGSGDDGETGTGPDFAENGTPPRILEPTL
jgi:hypothetical protein